MLSATPARPISSFSSRGVDVGAVAERVAVAHHRRETHAVADLPRLHPLPDLDDHAGGLVAHGPGKTLLEQRHPARVVQGGDVRVADAGGLDLDHDLAGSRRRLVDLVESERLAGAFELPCLHGVLLSEMRRGASPRLIPPL
jgi:hypothetical protein